MLQGQQACCCYVIRYCAPIFMVVHLLLLALKVSPYHLTRLLVFTQDALAW